MPRKKHGVWITFNDGKISEVDLMILFYIKDKPQSLTYLSKKIDVALKNISIRIPLLESEKLIKVNRQGEGRETLISLNLENPKVKEYLKIAHFKFFFDSETKKMTLQNQANLVKMIEENSANILGRQAVQHIQGTPSKQEASNTEQVKQ